MHVLTTVRCAFFCVAALVSGAPFAAVSLRVADTGRTQTVSNAGQPAASPARASRERAPRDRAAQERAARERAAQDRAASADPGNLEMWGPILRRLEADGFSKQRLQALFSRPEAVFNPNAMGDKLTTLYMRKYGLRLVRDIQTELKRLGYYRGPVDGKRGRGAKWAMKEYQKASGRKPDAKPTLDLLAALRAERRKAPPGLVMPAFKSPPVYQAVMRPERLAEGEAFYRENRDTLRRVRREYGIPEHVAAGLVTVETRAGNYLGSESALVNLASMSLAGDYTYVASVFDYEKPGKKQTGWLRKKARAKGDWAYRELKALLTYSDRIGRDPLTMPGSIYGAIGVCQFMPTNAVRYTVDGNGDGRADLFNTEDALFSMGNFLRVIGWKGEMNTAKIRKVLYRYNRSKTYVNTILAVADHLKKTDQTGG